jgi:hypothetical protein
MEDNNPTEGGTFQIFNSTEEMQASVSQPEAPVQEAPVESQPEPQPEAPMQESQYVDPEAAPSEPQQETIVEATPEQQADTTQAPQYSEQEIEGAVMNFLSERLGRQISSIDDLSPVTEPASPLDERVEAIAKFVQETGRSPQDWFTYQSLDPTEMDDVMAVRVNMATEYKDLSGQEIDLLMKSKYKLNPDIHTEEEIQLSQLQLKIDAAESRKRITDLRETYRAPEAQQQSQEPQSIVDEQWIANMSREVDSLTGLEFDLGPDKTFTFGLEDNYKSQLKAKNARLDEYFDPYIRDDGSWDIDTLSSHRALIDNIDHIAQSIYRQGLSDGQRGLVEKAANVQTSTPQQQNNNNTSDPVVDQLKQFMGGSRGMTFKI